MASASGQFLLGLIAGVCALFLLDPEAELDGPALILTGGVVPVGLALVARLVRWSRSIVGDAVGASLGYSLVVASAAAMAGSWDSAPVSIFLVVLVYLLVVGTVPALVAAMLVAAGSALRGQRKGNDEVDGA